MPPEIKPESVVESRRILYETTELKTRDEAEAFLARKAAVFPGGRMGGIPMDLFKTLHTLSEKAAKILKQRDNAEAVILGVLRKNARPMNFVEIHRAQDRYALGTIRQTMSLLRASGDIVRVREGYYALPEHVDAEYEVTYEPKPRNSSELPRRRTVPKRLQNIETAIFEFFENNEQGTFPEIVAWIMGRHDVPINSDKMLAILANWVESESVVITSSTPRCWRRVAGAFRKAGEGVIE